MFAEARGWNVARLREVSAAALLREGVQDEVGVIALGDVPRMMARHDQVHAAELAALAHLAAAPSVAAALTSHASAALPPTHPVAA